MVFLPGSFTPSVSLRLFMRLRLYTAVSIFFPFRAAAFHGRALIFFTVLQNTINKIIMHYTAGIKNEKTEY
jgi:hypothetical protein